LESKLVTNNNLTVKEAMSEMRQFSIHVDQAMAQLGDRLSGDALVNERLQNASNKFFRLNMLDQWTKFVQATSFSAGKHLINENIEALAKNGSRELTGRMQSRAGELAELGIDYKKAVDWYKAGGKTDDAFYKDDVLGGVARYTNSVVLQPTAMSGLKPLLHSNPKTAILFQLMGYPAAFTNTVLKGAAKQLTKDPIRNAGKIVPAALIMTGMARWTNYLRTNGESERNKDMDEIIGASVARWGGNGILLDSFQRAKTSAKYTQSSLSYAGMPFGPVTSDAINLIQQGIIPVVGGKVPLVSGSYFGKQILGDEEVTHYRRSLQNIQEDTFGGLIPEFDKEVPLPGYVAGGIISVGAKAVTNAITDFAGNKLGTLPAKIASKETAKDVELSKIQDEAYTKLDLDKDLNDLEYSAIDEVSQGLNKAMDNYFDADALEETSLTLREGLEELEANQIINLGDLGHVELINATLMNGIRKQNKSIDELEKIPSFIKATKSSNEQEAIENWAQFQKDMGFSKDHRNALKVIQDTQEEIDPTGEIDYLVGEFTRSLKALYDEVNIEVTPAERQAAEKASFDDESFDALHDFVSVSARERMPKLSEIGGDKVAENVLIKLAAEGEIDFPKIKPPKLADTLDDKYPEQLTGNQRIEAISKYTDKSTEKEIMFRAETSFQRSQFFLSFAFAREIGTHVGAEGAANVIAIRGLPDTKAKEALKTAADRQELTRERAGEMFSDPRLLEEELPEITTATRVDEFDVPIDDYGYGSKGTADAEDLIKLKPITMNAGYIDIRNPLQIDSDLAGWQAERILSPGGGFDEYFLPEILNRGVKITKKQQKKLDDLTKRSEEFEGLFLDSPVGEAKDTVGFYRQELKRAAINREFREVLEDMGFDSIRYKNEVEIGYQGESDYSYILFNPEQFKSVSARAFDPTDARHGAAKGGYIIKGGDTLSQIAKREGIPMEEIARLNNIKDVNKIYEGQKLKFSEKAPEAIVAQAKAVKAAEPIKEIEKAKPPEQRAKESKTVQALRKKQEKRKDSIIPINIRAFVSDIFGGGSEINENSLTKAERKELANVVKRAQEQGKSKIEYADYATEGDKQSQYADVGGGGGAGDFFNKVTDPAYSLKTTLGQAKISVDKKGNTIVTDQYNFNDSDGEFSVLGLIKGIKNAGLSPYAQIRNIAREFGSGEGEGAQVKINLGKLASNDVAKLEGAGGKEA
jgi:LysM repeat protein